MLFGITVCIHVKKKTFYRLRVLTFYFFPVYFHIANIIFQKCFERRVPARFIVRSAVPI